MGFEHRCGQGSLFVNNKKRPDKKDPDYDGRIMLPDGQLHWFKAWAKKDAAGQTFFSCQIGLPCNVHSAHKESLTNGYQTDSDIPF